MEKFAVTASVSNNGLATAVPFVKVSQFVIAKAENGDILGIPAWLFH